jgi:hypothetical protein
MAVLGVTVLLVNTNKGLLCCVISNGHWNSIEEELRVKFEGIVTIFTGRDDWHL